MRQLLSVLLRYHCGGDSLNMHMALRRQSPISWGEKIIGEPQGCGYQAAYLGEDGHFKVGGHVPVVRQLLQQALEEKVMSPIYYSSAFATHLLAQRVAHEEADAAQLAVGLEGLAGHDH